MSADPVTLHVSVKRKRGTYTATRHYRELGPPEVEVRVRGAADLFTVWLGLTTAMEALGIPPNFTNARGEPVPWARTKAADAAGEHPTYAPEPTREAW